jgi:hypothetical protein
MPPWEKIRGIPDAGGRWRGAQQYRAAVQADDITRRRLVLAKRIFQFAVSQQRPPSSTTSRVMGILGLDLSVESVAKAVALSLDPRRTPSDSFSGLLDQVDQLLEQAGLDELPNKAHVLHVHSLRNDVQHKAKILSEEDLSDSRTYVRDFLEDVVRSVWGLSFDQISMVDIVRDDELKARFHAAEAALQNEDWLHAAEEAVIGLYSAIERVRRALVGGSSNWTKAFLVEESFDRMKPDRDAWKAFQRMQDTVLYLALGMDYANLLRVTDLVGRPMFTIGGDASFSRQDEASVDREQAEFAVAYAVQAVVEIERELVSSRPHLAKSTGGRNADCSLLP